MNHRLLKVLEKVLGRGVSTSKGNVSFFSPFIQHRKRKLEIQIDQSKKTFGYWHCWVSNESGKNLFTLLKKINASSDVINEIAVILKETNYKKYLRTPVEKSIVKLPAEFKPLWKEHYGPEYKNALYYCKKRGLTKSDLIKYNIGYCEEGEYKGFVIIPSYNADGNLNYFVSRNYYDREPKHKNPPVDKSQIIGFELFINWNEPITLVEGAWDAISSGDNSIPLYGKTISHKLKKSIIENNVNHIYLGLDSDALNDALSVAKYFMYNGITVYLMELGNKDPNDLGFNEFLKIKQKTEELTSTKLLKYKLNEF